MSKKKDTAKLLTREQILSADDLGRELVTIDEWGGAVYVHTLTGAERDAWESEIVRARTKAGRIDIRGLKARLVVACVKDEGGTPIFSAADVPALQEKNAKAIDALFQVAQRLAGLSDAEMDELSGN